MNQFLPTPEYLIRNVSGFNDTGGNLPPVSTTPAANMPPVSMTPLANNGKNLWLLRL
jgi:hypothetical protein